MTIIKFYAGVMIVSFVIAFAWEAIKDVYRYFKK